MLSQLEQFKQLCEMSDEEEQHHLPTSVETHEEEEKKSVSADTAHGNLDWK